MPAILSDSFYGRCTLHVTDSFKYVIFFSAECVHEFSKLEQELRNFLTKYVSPTTMDELFREYN